MLGGLIKNTAKSLIAPGGGDMSGFGMLGNLGVSESNLLDFVPGIGDARAQEKANEQNIKLDRINKAWMERMSNTSYQRGMDDMKKAGLNPMLAFQQGGASVPSSTAPVVGAASKTALVDAGMKAFTGISNVRTAQQQANTAQAQAESGIQLQSAQAAKEVAQAQNIQKDTQVKAADIELKKRELRGKGIRDTLDREGGAIIQKLFDSIKHNASPMGNSFIKSVSGDTDKWEKAILDAKSTWKTRTKPH